jgi:hypothetical protein
MARRKFKLVVNREERVAATPETVAKARGCIVNRLFQSGDLKFSIDSQQYEAAWEIMEAFEVITGVLGYRPMDLTRADRGESRMGAKAIRLWDQYVRWGNELIKRRHIRPHVVVEWLKMERQFDREAIGLLRGSLDDWSLA